MIISLQTKLKIGFLKQTSNLLALLLHSIEKILYKEKAANRIFFLFAAFLNYFLFLSTIISFLPFLLR